MGEVKSASCVVSGEMEAPLNVIVGFNAVMSIPGETPPIMESPVIEQVISFGSPGLLIFLKMKIHSSQPSLIQEKNLPMHKAILK